MPRINRNVADPAGGFIGRPHTRDRKKRQSEHAWWTALDRPTMEELQKMHDDEEAETKWKTKMLGPPVW